MPPIFRKRSPGDSTRNLTLGQELCRYEVFGEDNPSYAFTYTPPSVLLFNCLNHPSHGQHRKSRTVPAVNLFHFFSGETPHQSIYKQPLAVKCIKLSPLL